MEFQTPMDALAVLGLDQNATKDDIKTAYHKLVAYYHPDAHAADEAETTESFLVIQQAYEYLMDAYEKAVAAYVAEQAKPRVLGSKAAIARQETNRHFAEERLRQERRLAKEREAKRRKVNEELASYEADTAYEEAMARIHAIRAAEITAHIIESVVLGKGVGALDKPFE